jgi:hypothetical protein
MDGWMDEAYTIALGGKKVNANENKPQVHDIPVPFLSCVVMV